VFVPLPHTPISKALVADRHQHFHSPTSAGLRTGCASALLPPHSSPPFSPDGKRVRPDWSIALQRYIPRSTVSGPIFLRTNHPPDHHKRRALTLQPISVPLPLYWAGNLRTRSTGREFVRSRSPFSSSYHRELFGHTFESEVAELAAHSVPLTNQHRMQFSHFSSELGSGTSQAHCELGASGR